MNQEGDPLRRISRTTFRHQSHKEDQQKQKERRALLFFAPPVRGATPLSSDKQHIFHKQENRERFYLKKMIQSLFYFFSAFICQNATRKRKFDTHSQLAYSLFFYGRDYVFIHYLYNGFAFLSLTLHFDTVRHHAVTQKRVMSRQNTLRNK